MLVLLTVSLANASSADGHFLLKTQTDEVTIAATLVDPADPTQTVDIAVHDPAALIEAITVACEKVGYPLTECQKAATRVHRDAVVVLDMPAPTEACVRTRPPRSPSPSSVRRSSNNASEAYRSATRRVASSGARPPSGYAAAASLRCPSSGTWSDT
jgi:hypothetical protein